MASKWEECEVAAAAAGEKVTTLKAEKAGKEDIDAAVAVLKAAKDALKASLEQAMAALGPESDEYKALQVKLPAAPKPSKKDKKASADKSQTDKEVANKTALEAKIAAREKKKAAAVAKAPAVIALPAPAVPAPSMPTPAVPAPLSHSDSPPSGLVPASDAPAAAAPTSKKSAEANKTFELHFAKERPPLLAIILARMAKQEVMLKRVTMAAGEATLIFPYGRARLSGDAVIARYFARAAPPSLSLYGYCKAGGAPEPLVAAQIDQWVDAATAIGECTGDTLKTHLVRLNVHLRMRAALAGHTISLADAAVWIALRKALVDVKKLNAIGVHLSRWWKFVDASAAMVVVAQDFFGASKDAGSMDIPLPDAVYGEVCTRFAPEPSGQLHIGHVKACMLSAYFAEQYGGKLLLRFDDTNPSKEKGEYEEAIIKDLRALKIEPHKVSHTSDHFEKILAIGTDMLKQGLAFIDPSPQEEQGALRMKKQPSPYRDAPVEESLRLWKEMQAASEEGLKCCMRAKIDYGSDNGALRDPTIYRCNLEPHNMTKDKYKVYPTYDLVCPIVDSMEGVTHALRDRQYSDRDAQYLWFIDKLKLRDVKLWGFSRINFVKTLLSKRKLQWLIDEGRVDGWDDPRFPTVAGVLRRGMTVTGLKTFILSMGASKNTNLMGWDKIWATNKAVIDSTAHRYTALLSEGLVPFTLSCGPSEPYAEAIFAHPKDESLGKKIRFFSSTVQLQADDAATLGEGEEVTLMSWGNAIVRRVHKNANGGVCSIEGDLHLEGSVKSTKKKLTWLADTPELVDVELVDYDFLLSKDKVEEEDNLKDILAVDTMFVDAARGEPALRQLQRGQIIQVERRGYYICDRPFVRASEPLVLLFVPDGKNMMGVKR